VAPIPKLYMQTTIAVASPLMKNLCMSAISHLGAGGAGLHRHCADDQDTIDQASGARVAGSRCSTARCWPAVLPGRRRV